MRNDVYFLWAVIKNFITPQQAESDGEKVNVNVEIETKSMKLLLGL